MNWIIGRYDNGELQEENSGGHDAAFDEERDRLIVDIKRYIKVNQGAIPPSRALAHARRA